MLTLLPRTGLSRFPSRSALAGALALTVLSMGPGAGPGLGDTVALAATTSPTPSATGSASSEANTSNAADDQYKLLLILDVSGSMKEPDASGSSKMKAAQAALAQVIASLPPNAEVGLRVYGAKVVGGRPTPEACADTQLAMPVGPLDAAKLVNQIKTYQPKGETPIAFSLAQAAKDLGTTGDRNVILMSDGKESCTTDPCPSMREMIQSGINLRLDTVGVEVDEAARKQLSCLAEAGNGSYYDIKETDQLASDIQDRAAPPPPTPTPTVVAAPAPPAPSEPRRPWPLLVAAAGGLLGIAALVISNERRRQG